MRCIKTDPGREAGIWKSVHKIYKYMWFQKSNMRPEYGILGKLASLGTYRINFKHLF